MRTLYYLIVSILIIGCTQNQQLEAAQTTPEANQSKTGITMTQENDAMQAQQGKSSPPELLCGSKPNCVSTQEIRTDHHIEPFNLTSEQVSMDDIEKVVLTLKRAKIVDKTATTLHIEVTSLVFRFVDDVHMVKEGLQLHVRSKSRTGYSDFGVNKKRTDEIRQKLITAGLIKPSAITP